MYKKWSRGVTIKTQFGSFEWYEPKNRANQLKHGLAFEDAEHVFQGSCVTFRDPRAYPGEQRNITLGRLQGRVVVIVHTERDGVVRIISMRKGNKREQRAYQERLEAD